MLKRIINLGGIYYACISGILLLLASLFGGDLAIIEPLKLLFILMFCFVMSTGTAVKECDSVSSVTGVICHAFCHIGGFFFLVVLPYDNGFTFSVISLVIFSIGYVIACMVKTAVKKRTYKANGKVAKAKTDIPAAKTKKSPSASKKSAQEQEYKSLFSDK